MRSGPLGVKNTRMSTDTRASQGGASPHDEVKLGPGQHENAQQRGDGSVDHRGKHVLQSHSGALVSVSNRRQEALRWREGGVAERRNELEILPIAQKNLCFS